MYSVIMMALLTTQPDPGVGTGNRNSNNGNVQIGLFNRNSRNGRSGGGCGGYQAYTAPACAPTVAIAPQVAVAPQVSYVQQTIQVPRTVMETQTIQVPRTVMETQTVNVPVQTSCIGAYAAAPAAVGCYGGYASGGHERRGILARLRESRGSRSGYGCGGGVAMSYAVPACGYGYSVPGGYANPGIGQPGYQTMPPREQQVVPPVNEPNRDRDRTPDRPGPGYGKKTKDKLLTVAYLDRR